MISRDDIKKLAGLARITITDKEATTLAEEAEAILGYVSQIGDVELKKEGDSHTTLLNVMRDDAHPHEPGVYTKELLSEAPHTEDGYITVRKVISKD